MFRTMCEEHLLYSHDDAPVVRNILCYLKKLSYFVKLPCDTFRRIVFT
jgi:hypothetical protein